MARAWRFGDSVNTDQIIPGRFNVTTDRSELGRACFVELRPEFAGSVQPGDVIVAGSDFGCGSSREHAVLAIQATGVAAVLAPSFGRIFYRNAINLGLTALECADADWVADGTEVVFDPGRGFLREIAGARQLTARPLPAFAQRIAGHGGVLELVRAHGSLQGSCGSGCGVEVGMNNNEGESENDPR
ncbi:MAG TPA: 3-isopropylmalate dehydratase [Candidatus Dormibacteraeota bacterium]|nr:3-isopropylmalate dehydratase [Candidatus Dormibacteraeota bacterium]